MAAGDAWTEHALGALARHGYRAGGARSAVVEVLGRQGGCLTADQVVADLRDKGGRAGPASVYRALNLLCDLGLVHRAVVGEGPARYDLVDPGGEHDHHHHLVCDRCGRTVAFTDRRLEKAIDDVSARVGYAVDSHDVTLRGACAQCAR
ncbi:MAG TPA: Fur family transcriptional regulator [Thermoleophilaceae bacterium]|nr:Fur family transcriptional regulator [Thermoleophilaceae bacterium]